MKVGLFSFPSNFITFDVEEDRKLPLILGRPFLVTGRSLIDVEADELIMQFQNQTCYF